MIRGFIFTLLFCVSVLFFWNRYFPFDHFVTLTGITLLTFSILVGLLFVITSRLIKIKSETDFFIPVVMMGVLLKFILSFIIIFIFYKTYQPNSGNFVLPFIFIYVCFTVYETIYLDKMVRN